VRRIDAGNNEKLQSSLNRRTWPICCGKLVYDAQALYGILKKGQLKVCHAGGVKEPCSLFSRYRLWASQRHGLE